MLQTIGSCNTIFAYQLALSRRICGRATSGLLQALTNNLPSKLQFPLRRQSSLKSIPTPPSFSLKESPISEGGRWIGGKTVGIDWGDVSTTPGYAIGHAGPKRFADATALLTGTWGPTQTAEAVVSSKAPANWPEVSLRLRSSLSAHHCSGYEISNSLRKGNSAYLIIVRWNGPLADFTYLAQIGGAKYGVTNGDVVKATIVGNVITAYKNGVKLAQVTRQYLFHR